MKQKMITAEVGYSMLTLPLDHPMAGTFLSIMKETKVINAWSGASKITGNYEFFNYDKGKPELGIKEVEFLREAELEAHKTGVPTIEGVQNDPPRDIPLESSDDDCPF